MSYKNEIHNIFSYVERQGTADNDSIFNYAEGATLNGGAGDDLISLGGAYEVVRYFNGGGNDTVLGAGQNTTLDVDYDSVEFTSDAVILGVGDNSITLKDLTAGFRFENTVVGTANDDYIRTEGAEGLRVIGFSGNDSILNYALNTTVEGGAGNDSIYNGNEGKSGRNALILGGDGDDTLGNAGYYATLNGGRGNDVIRLSSGVDAVLEYHDGDGDDTVYGISDKLTFAFDYDSYTRSGNDVIVPIGDGSITFKSAYRDSRFFRLLRGTDGDDLLTNDKVYFSIDGGKGNDTLVNPGNDVTLNGGAGDDVISLNGGLTYIDYTSGNDTVYGFNEWTGQLAFRYDSLEEAGNDVIVRVGDGSITLKDTTRAQVLFVMRGTDDADFIRNSSRVKYIVSGAGDDTIINEAGSSTIDGGDDNDSIVSYSERSRYVLIRGGEGNDSIGVGGGYSTVEGGGGDDFINNGGYANAVDGGKGKDVIENEGDQSTLRGGADNDSMSNNAQYSTLDGDEGNDALTNSGWYSMLRGGAGNDTLINRDGKATFDGGDGNDVISLVGGRAVVQYSGGNDSIYGYDEYTTLAFNYDSVSRAGSDVIMRIGSGSVTFKNLSSSMLDQLAPVAASDAGDTIYNERSFQNILGGAGNDSIHQFFGTSVTIDGAGGNDTIISDGGGNASILGGDGDDYINSNEYATIDGGNGNDTIINKGDSSINGGAGNDLIVDNNTSSYPATIAGGAGNDTVSLKSGRARLEYANGDGNDVIYGFTDLTTLGFNYDAVNRSGNDVVLTVGNGSITLKDTPICLLTGKIEGKPVHSDNIVNKSSNKYITTYSGGDTITNKGSNVYINAGDDRDVIANSGGGSVSIFGGSGNDTIANTGTNATINGGLGNDRINISGGSVVLQFADGDGNDTVTGFNDKSTLDFNLDGIRQSGSNVIATVGRGSITFVNTPIERVYPKVNGSNANDLLVNEKNFAQVNGGNGNDTIVNSADKVTLDGGAGNDVISLDGGSARINYTSGNDTVYGYDSSTTLGFDYDSAVQSGADVILKKGGGSITLKETAVDPFIPEVTIDGGNVITLNGSARVEYSGGDGTVYGYGSNATLNFDYDSIAQSGNDVILGVGDGSITLKDVSIDAFKSTVSGSDGNDHIVNDRPLVYIDGGAGNDSIVNTGDNVTIVGGTGNDVISLGGGSALVRYSIGNDTVFGLDDNATLDFTFGAFERNGSNVLMTVDGGQLTFVDTSLARFIGGAGGSNDDDSIVNADDDKYLDGRAGNDTLTNSGANATVEGGAGDDVISLVGGSARIEYEYGDGNDTVYGFDSDTTLGFAYDAVERSGNDVIVSIDDASITFKDASIARFINGIEGSDGADSIANADDGKYIDGKAGNDTLTNSGFDATIAGGAGDDFISLDGGSARIFYRDGDGNDTIFGFDGSTTLDFEYDAVAKSGADVIMTVGNNALTLKETSYARFVDGIVGSNANDRLINTDPSKYIDGAGGNDTITNSGSNATIEGGAGNDRIVINGGSGASINGGAGNDVISLGGGSARIFFQSGDGNDTLYGFNDNTTLDFDYDAVRQSGNDVIMSVGDGSITFKNTAIVRFLDDAVIGTDGDDSITNSEPNKYVYGGAGNDYIYSNRHNATLDGAAGDDTINNNAGGDAAKVLGGDGNDEIRNASQGATVDGGNGNDYINVAYGSSRSSISGGAGNDTVYNNPANTINITINGGAGDDIISINGGSALLQYSLGDGDDTVIGFSDKTTLDFEYGAVQQSGNDVIMSIGSGSLTLKDTSIAQIVGGIVGTEANDNLSNNAPSTYIDGRAGNDTITNSADNATIDGGKGNDVIILDGGAAAIVRYFNGEGNDTVLGAGQNTTLDVDYDSVEFTSDAVILGVGDNSITLKDLTAGFRFENTVVGSAGNDLITNSDSEGLYVLGLAGNDTIVNTGDNATINGGDGNDVISLDGGSAIIQYNVGDGNDTIIGFDDNVILAFDYDTLTKSGADVVMSIGDAVLTFKETSIAQLLDGIAGTDGDDNLSNGAPSKYIDAGAGNDSITNIGDDVTIAGSSGDDVISLNGGSALIEYADGDGNDSIYGFDGNSTLGFDYDSIAKAGADVIMSIGDGSITFKNTSIAHFLGGIAGTDADDSISNFEVGQYLDGRAGNDTITNFADNATIDGGSGNDVIILNDGSARILFQSGDDNDSVYGFDGNSTLDFNYDSVEQSGNDVIMSIGDGSITFKNTSIAHFLDDAIIGTDADDSISNELAWRYILGGDGDDLIENSGEDVTINGADGNDTIINDRGANSSLLGGAGDDYINTNQFATVDGGAGNDTIINRDVDSSLNGGAGDDSIVLAHGSSDYSTVTGGAGNDTITFTPVTRVVVEYAAGDGNDVILGSNEYTSLAFDYDSIEQSGNDAVLTVGNGSVTLKDTPISMITNRLDGTAYSDNLTNKSSNKYIAALTGNDTITNRGSNVYINGGDGNDTVYNRGSNVYINGGRGSDCISLIGGSAILKYAAGDGNDIVFGFNENTTLDFNYDNVQQSGADVIMSIGDGSITFKDTALSLFVDENSNDQLSTILEPTAPVELGDIDPAVSKIFLSIDKHFGVNRIAHRRRT